MNAIENEQICKSAIGAIASGSGSLSVIPKLIAKIIETQAWLEREVRPGKIVRLGSLRELITSKPMEGWGEDPDKIEALLHDDAETLTKWREAMKHQGERTDFGNNVTEVDRVTGNSKAYTLSRLKRETPELFDSVVAGNLSANAAAIQAGFRKKPSAAETCVKAFRKAENRLEVLKLIVGELEPHERGVLADWLE